MENRLQEYRMILGMTKPQVSERLKQIEPRADVGMVSRYEKGVCIPTKEQLECLREMYGIPMTELYRLEDLDLLGLLPLTMERKPTEDSERGKRAEPPSHLGRIRKCYRISQEFASTLPDDLLQVCGYSSWQSWHDACLKRLLGEYAARKGAAKRKGGKIA